MKSILILGSGTAGSIVTNKLARELRKNIAQDHVQIKVLDKSTISYNQAGFTFVPFGYLTKQDLFRDKQQLLSPRVKCIFGKKGTLESLNLDEQQVTTTDGAKHPYDYLVIATGCQADIGAVSGLENDFNSFYTSYEDATALGKKINNFKKGKVVFLVPKMPIPCPGAPGKFSTMLYDYLKYVKKIHDDPQIKLLWPTESIGPPAYNSIVHDSLSQKGIDIQTNYSFEKVDEQAKQVVGRNGEKTDYDLLVVAPPHKTIRPLRDSEITNDAGWIPTNKTTLRVKNYEQVYAIGDNGNPEIPKTGIAAHYQSLITAQNIINQIHGIDTQIDYNGEAGCPFVGSSNTSHTKGKAYIPIWTYDKPPKQFPVTELGWLFYRLYYYMHWDTTIKGLM